MRKFWTTTFESFVTNSTLKSPWVIQGLYKVLLLVYIMNIFLPKSRGGGFAGPLLLTVLGQVSPSSTVIIVMYVTTIRRCTSQVTRFPQLTALDCMHRLVVFQTWPRTFFDRRHHSTQCVQSAYFVAWRLLSVLKIELPNLLRFWHSNHGF